MTRRPSPIRGKTVVITGASAGVGRATAHRFARAGARIGLIARDRIALNAAKLEVEALGGSALVLPADVADAAALRAAAEETVETFGVIDIWINNAMSTVFSRVEDITPEEFKRVTEVTYLGCVHGTQAALQHMLARNNGTIVQIGSALAYRSIPLQAAYCGAKHAIRGFTNALRSELIHSGSRIKLVVVELPAVNTPQFDWARTHLPLRPRPVAPVIQPEVIGDAVYQAALRPKREYWVGRSTIEVILGNFVVPAMLDGLMARKAYWGQMTRLPVRSSRRNNLMTPVTPLHRTHGSFDHESRRRAVMMSGTTARVLVAVSAAALVFGAGALLRAAVQKATAKVRHH